MADTRRVLVVEDDRLTREAIRTVLEAAGYRVECVADGQDALDRLRARGSPWLIVLDLNMPGLSGRAFREEQLRDPALASVPVVLVSGESDLDRTARILGAVAHVAKPFDLDEVLETVWRLDGGHAGGSPARPDVPTRGISPPP